MVHTQNIVERPKLVGALCGVYCLIIDVATLSVYILLKGSGKANVCLKVSLKLD